MRNTTNIELLAASKIVHIRPVAWGDQDAMKHVNNTRYFYYAETARFEMMQALQDFQEPVDPSELKITFALAGTSARFKVPVTYPDEVIIGSRVVQINDTQFTLRHDLYSKKLECIACEIEATLVYYNFEKGRRQVIDADLLSRLEYYS